MDSINYWSLWKFFSDVSPVEETNYLRFESAGVRFNLINNGASSLLPRHVKCAGEFYDDAMCVRGWTTPHTLPPLPCEWTCWVTNCAASLFFTHNVIINTLELLHLPINKIQLGCHSQRRHSVAPPRPCLMASATNEHKYEPGGSKKRQQGAALW